MELKLWTVHRKGARDLWLVADRFSLFALLLPPIWAIWHGLWVILFGMVSVLLVAALVNPLAASPAMYAIGFIAAFEGGALKRLELKSRGWHEVATVEAATEEGAEELWMSGEGVRA